jgi:hypothetical protein
MKKAYCYIAALAMIASMTACKKDNFTGPGTSLTGRLVYKGDSILVEYNQVNFEVYQYGFGKVGPITGTFTQSGTYALQLFNGDYKFIIPNGQGPFQFKQTAQGAPDTIAISLKGNQVQDIEVTPYYMIRNPQLSVASGKVNGAFRIEKIITGASAKDIERVSLYVNRTQFVSGADNIAVTDVSGSAITDPNNVSLQVTIPNLVPAQHYVFARIGLKIAGVEDMIFSPVVQLQL